MTNIQPIVNQEDLFLDMDGKPLVHGKVEFLDPVSTDFLDIYTYSDDEYTPSDNPIVLDIDGRPQHTVFSDRLTYCRAYRYEGIDETTREPVYVFVRDFYAGHDVPSEIKSTVTGIEELKDLDPSLNTEVTVVGYYSSSDCEPRNYFWDPNSSLDPDGGYVVKSDVSDRGRWILQFDGEYLPSTYYGVYPGSDSNVNALASYPAVIGGRATAPGIYFAPGTYSFVSAFSTAKKVMLDADTSFACPSFLCDSLEVVGEPSAAIADFVFSSSTQTAHSSWFRSVTAFWSCGAGALVIDGTDNFTDKSVGYQVTVTGASIVGSTRIPATYTGSGRLILDKCVITGNRLFSAADRIRFTNTAFRDEWFSNPSSIDFANGVIVRSTAMNVIELSNFGDETAYVNAVAADGQTRLDMQGRYAPTVTVPSGITEIYNVCCGTLTYSSPSSNLTVYGTRAASASVSCAQLVVDNSDISFSQEPVASTLAAFRNSRVSGGTWTSARPYVFSNCTVGVNFATATDNTTATGGLQFNGCVFVYGKVMSVKNLTMRDCVLDGLTLKVYPYMDQDGYRMSVTLVNNVFNGSIPVELTKFADDNCYEVAANWIIQGNSFNGNSEGISCRYWQNRLGSNGNKTFIAPDTRSKITYFGNTGSCPAENMRGNTLPASTSVWSEVDIGSGNTIYLYTYGGARACPDYIFAEDAPTYNKWYNVGTQAPDMPVTVDSSDGMSLKSDLNIRYWQRSRSYSDRDGDFFDLGFAAWVTEPSSSQSVKVM